MTTERVVTAHETSSWPGSSRPSTSLRQSPASRRGCPGTGLGMTTERGCCRLPSMRGGWVYIVTNRPNGTLYLGVTSHLPRRAWEHRSGEIKGFTAQYGLKMLVWHEHHDDIRTAI